MKKKCSNKVQYQTPTFCLSLILKCCWWSDFYYFMKLERNLGGAETCDKKSPLKQLKLSNNFFQERLSQSQIHPSLFSSFFPRFKAIIIKLMLPYHALNFFSQKRGREDGLVYTSAKMKTEEKVGKLTTLTLPRGCFRQYHIPLCGKKGQLLPLEK